MYSRLGHERSYSSGHVPQENVPMPEIPSPSYHQSQNFAAPTQSYDYGDLSHGDYDQYEGDDLEETAFDPEAHRQSYYQESYQPSIHDAPLLSRHSTQHSQFSIEGQPPFLQYRGHTESYHSNPESRVDSTGTSHQLKRSRSIKEVQLFHGNLVLDCPVPPKLLNADPNARPRRDEYTHMRYTAATCDPADFYSQQFTLRQQLFAQRRHTELLIVVTMYNEDDVLFARTMVGVFQNIEYMCSGKGKTSHVWGKEGWKKIVVCIVSDGRAKINARTRAVLTGLGVYQNGVAKQKVNDKDVMAHIYEYTTRVGIDLKNNIVEIRPGTSCPVQLLFCLKENNQKKINSHRWAIQAFGQVLQPNVCVLLDAGTRPGKDSIYQLWRAFDLDPMCGGACGEIKAMLDGGKNLVNPLVATQNFEYKMSNILDKPMESAFGFISVLPGAFSAYRYVALQNDKRGEGPLEKYFAGEKMHANAGIFAANMYLAEDRILCFELVSKRKSSWVLTYVKSATGETDVPDTMTELILQRRRWLNGSFFAAVYALAHFYQVFRSSHSMARKIFFLIEFTYQLITMIFAWFAVGNFFLVFHILTTSLGDPDLLGTVGRILGVVAEWFYLGALVTCFVLSLGNRPQGSNRFYMAMVYSWAGIMIYLFAAAVFISFKSVQAELSDGKFTISKLFSNSLFFTLIVSLLSTYVLWVFVSIIFLDPWHIATCTVQYLLLSPTYINVINVYAFCNTHDITWGTKGDDKAEKLPSATVKSDGKVNVDISIDDGDLNALYTSELQKFSHIAPEEKKEPSTQDVQEDYYKGFRSAVVLTWMFCNAALVAIVLNSGGLNRLSTKKQTSDVTDQSQVIKVYMLVVLWSVACLSAFKFAGAIWYLIGRSFISRRH